MSALQFGRGEEIRTPGPMVPNHVRYQTALHPDTTKFIQTCDYSTILYTELFVKEFSYVFRYFFSNCYYSLISNLSPLNKSAIVAVAFSSLDQDETSSSSFLAGFTLFTGAEVAVVSNFLAFFFALFSLAS